MNVQLTGYVGIPQRLANVNGAKEELIILADNAQLTEHLGEKDFRNSGHNNTLHFFLSEVTNRYPTSTF